MNIYETFSLKIKTYCTKNVIKSTLNRRDVIKKIEKVHIIWKESKSEIYYYILHQITYTKLITSI